MHRTLLPKFTILLLISCIIPVAAQKKTSGEVDITKCWTYPAGDAVGESLVSDGTRIFIGFDGARVEAVSLDGKKAWSTELGGEIRSNLMPSDTNLFIVTSTAATEAGKPADHLLRALSKETGITNWTLKLDKAERFFLGLSNASVIIVSSAGVVEGLDPKDGVVKWKRQIAEKFVAGPVFFKENVTVATASNQIFVVSLATGEIESMRKMSVAVALAAIGRTANGDLIVGNERGDVMLFVGSADKPYWKFKTGGEISQVDNAGGNVLAVSHDNFVYLLAGRNGRVTWKKRMPGRISAAAVYAGKFVVLSGFEQHTSLLLDILKGRVAGQILLAGDETMSSILPSAGRLLVLTSAAAYAYSLEGCAK